MEVNVLPFEILSFKNGKLVHSNRKKVAKSIKSTKQINICGKVMSVCL